MKLNEITSADRWPVDGSHDDQWTSRLYHGLRTGPSSSNRKIGKQCVTLYKNRKRLMENSLKCHWTLKNVQTFRAEPFISVNSNIPWIQNFYKHLHLMVSRVRVFFLRRIVKHSFGTFLDADSATMAMEMADHTFKTTKFTSHIVFIGRCLRKRLIPKGIRLKFHPVDGDRHNK